MALIDIRTQDRDADAFLKWLANQPPEDGVAIRRLLAREAKRIRAGE